MLGADERAGCMETRKRKKHGKKRARFPDTFSMDLWI